MKFSLGLIPLAALIAGSLTASAQDYPTKPITMIVPLRREAEPMW